MSSILLSVESNEATAVFMSFELHCSYRFDSDMSFFTAFIFIDFSFLKCTSRFGSGGTAVLSFVRMK